jgi:hypothetical protein
MRNDNRDDASLGFLPQSNLHLLLAWLVVRVCVLSKASVESVNETCFIAPSTVGFVCERHKITEKKQEKLSCNENHDCGKM